MNSPGRDRVIRELILRARELIAVLDRIKHDDRLDVYVNVEGFIVEKDIARLELKVVNPYLEVPVFIHWTSKIRSRWLGWVLAWLFGKKKPRHKP